MYTDAEARAVLSLLAATIVEAHRVGPSSWELTLFPNAFRLNVGRYWAFTGKSGKAYFLVDERAVDDKTREAVLPLAAIEPGEGSMYMAAPAAVAIPKDQVATLAASTAFPHLQNAHFQALHESARKCPLTPYRSAHSPGLLRFMRAFLGAEIPDPAYAQSSVLPAALEELREAFSRFRESEPNRFRVELRRHQTDRIRQLLANPEALDLDTFNREIWPIESGAYLHGTEKVRIVGAPDDWIQARLPELDQALRQGELELHGNAMWGSGSRVYGPMLKDEEEKLQNIRQAVRILNNSSVSPLRQAQEMLEIKGFGPNISTGLVMAFHPNDFAIYNAPSREALRQLGYEESTLEAFEVSMGTLKEELGADDFLELDLFLYLHRERDGELGGEPDAAPTRHVATDLAAIVESIRAQGIQVEDRTIRRYHLSLKVRGFVILSGISGTGKTWLTEAYARAVGAEYRLVAVAPNWNTNEDLLGYYNPLDDRYHDTDFSLFLRAAAAEYQDARAEGRAPKPFHLTLDEMNLARVEYYFAKFLSAMETRERGRPASIELGNGEAVLLPPNLFVTGTVNVDETTHGFADKVYDRAQLIELPLERDALDAYLGELPYRDPLLDIWDAVEAVAPFAFRVVRDIREYVTAAGRDGETWETALDEQILQKILPKLARTDAAVGDALTEVCAICEQHGFTLSYAKASAMRSGFVKYGIASYF
jgi:MoxR-like ATPase